MPPDPARAIFERYRLEWRNFGRSDNELPLMGISRHIVLADTDAEARHAVLDGFAGRFWNEYFKPIVEKLNATHMFRRPGANQAV